MKREAILIAGMHRSGTSALTRVLSLLGAGLPKNLLPAMKGVNEQGFWESADLVDLHEELLLSAGSYWQDWSEFNQSWYQSAVGRSYKQRLHQFVEQDFASSNLFVIKDPRICRFLPLWLDTLSNLDIKPIVVIPVRHPMEVAHSLKKRDGFSIGKSLLIWSRHVLDAVFYAKDVLPVFVSYEDLLLDWKRVVHQISSQGTVFFPAMSAEREFEIDKFVDVRAKKNDFFSRHADKDTLAGSGGVAEEAEFGAQSFAKHIFSKLSILVDSESTAIRSDALADLLVIRDSFNQSTGLFAVPFHEERVIGKAHLSKLGELEKSCAEKLSAEQARFSKEQEVFVAERGRFKADKANFEVERLGFFQEHKLLEEKIAGLDKTCADFEAERQKFDDERTGFESERQKFDDERTGFESERQKFDDERAGFESERQKFDDERTGFKSERQKFDDERAGFESERQKFDDERAGFDAKSLELNKKINRLSNVNAVLARKMSSKDVETVRLTHDLDVLRQTAASILDVQRVASDDQLAVLYQDVLIKSEPISVKTVKVSKKQLVNYRSLFDFSFYQVSYQLSLKDVDAAIMHYCEYGVRAGYDPHPLFCTRWYLEEYPDVRAAGINPLLHFITVGGRERRSPHPLFNVAWYLESYPDVAESGENSLLHYLRSGYKEARNPNPLFDAARYQALYPELRDQNPLLHYLKHGCRDKPETHSLFMTSLLYEKYPVLNKTEMPALMFYYQFGERWGWEPHPLFDSHFYREKYELSAEMSAINHFLSDGQKHLLEPSVLFDTQWYLENYPDVAGYGKHPLLHYLTEGAAQGFKPNIVFDPGWYQAQYAGELNYVEPLTDYVSVGHAAGRNPGPYFDSVWYLQQAPTLPLSVENPLLHYLAVGRFEGLRTSPREVDRKILPYYPKLPIAIEQEAVFSPEYDWSVFTPRTNGSVDVIIPVYKGFDETLNCIYSVLSAEVDATYCLIVINDASPDKGLIDVLESCVEAGLFCYASNQQNAGFVATVNRGMDMHPERDVVLLNSDAEVYDGWLDRILAVASEYNDSATITPLSNNATICSYPFFPERDFEPLEVDYAELDRFAAEVNKGVVVEAPTGVGFCMYLRRTCLNAIGLFDQEAFGRGYGEENDFCQRAEHAGWKNLITADTFVRHWGGASFQEEKQSRIDNAIQVLNKRYPGYLPEVRGFIHENPLAQARENLDWRRLSAECRERNILIICHNRGGGTEKHLREDVTHFVRSGYGVFFMRPDTRYPSHVVLSGEEAHLLPNLSLLEFSDTQSVVRAWERLSITDVHTHGLVDFLPDAARSLAEAVILYRAQVGSLNWEANIHDYKVICPRITLSDELGVYCGEPGEYGCNRCLQKRGSEFPVNNIADWREIHDEALQVADKVIVPDKDVSQRLERYYSSVVYEVSPHERLSNIKTPVFPLELKNPAKLKIVVVGAISRQKGFDVLAAAARFAKMHNLSIEFVLLGYGIDDALLAECGVDVLGKYSDETVLAHLTDLNADIVWLPSLWPETYSYTLSLALRAGLPVAAFDIGAIARRLTSLGQGELLMPLNWHASPDVICEFFMKHINWVR